ncbi:MAG: polyether ionophore transport system permease protein [Actinomycetota bacterium]|jgi:ABC-2 type transport system permease protein
MHGRAIAELVYRQQRRGAVIWGSVFGTFVWISAYGYAAAYPTVADRASIVKTLGANKGIRSIFGPARGLDTVAGFTAWRCATSFAVIGAVWGLLLATKVLRGDEEDGRADLLFAGPVTRAGGLRGQLVGLAITWVVLFTTVAAWIVTVGVAGGYFSWSAGLWFAFVACSSAAIFIGVGAVTSQLTHTRRAAAALAGGAFAAGMLVRAAAESFDGAHWITWLSPVGWTDRMHPLTNTNLTPALVVMVAVAAAVWLALFLAAHRDLGCGVLPSRDTADAKTGLLGSPAALALRLTRGTTIGWAAGLFVFAAVFGTVSTAVSDAFKSDSSVSDIFNRLGADISARGYVGVTFVMLSAALGLTAATFVGACRAEEADGRLEVLTAGPLRRRTWLGTRVAIGAASLVLLGVIVGVGGWVGVATSGGDIGFGDMLLAGLNTVAPALLVLGVATLAYGVVPRIGTQVAYALVAWSFLVEMVGALVNLNHFVVDTSIIHHLAAAPAVDPRWGSALLMVAVALACAVGGTLALQRRDLAPG